VLARVDLLIMHLAAVTPGVAQIEDGAELVARPKFAGD
jgi:hypothetical protein